MIDGNINIIKNLAYAEVILFKYFSFFVRWRKSPAITPKNVVTIDSLINLNGLNLSFNFFIKCPHDSDIDSRNIISKISPLTFDSYKISMNK